MYYKDIQLFLQLDIHIMSDENKKEKLSDDIRDWYYQIDKNKVVIFEEYKNTLDRSGTTNEEEIEEDSEEEETDLPLKLKELAIYHSSIGPVMIPEFSDPTKHFKLWTMYTSIPLTTKLLVNIEKTDGIESLEPLSRYRARIGIGPLFKDGIVIGNVTKLIKEAIPFEIKSLPNSG